MGFVFIDTAAVVQSQPPREILPTVAVFCRKKQMKKIGLN